MLGDCAKAAQTVAQVRTEIINMATKSLFFIGIANGILFFVFMVCGKNAQTKTQKKAATFPEYWKKK